MNTWQKRIRKDTR